MVQEKVNAQGVVYRVRRDHRMGKSRVSQRLDAPFLDQKQVNIHA
jgi:hypothetical protein